MGSAEELVAVLTPANAGRRILVLAGEYEVEAPLVVPDDATLEGAGVMTFGADGLPTGFAEGTRTAIRRIGDGPGDVVVLGDLATIRGLEIADRAGRTGGNVVGVVSRRIGDVVSAAIVECELINPNPPGIAPNGPNGRALVVLSLNLGMAQDPPPHEGAAIAARMVRSIVRSPAGGHGLFAINFAPNSTLSITLAGNVIGGGIDSNGGVSRPDFVHDASVHIDSIGNVYRDDQADPCSRRMAGFAVTGGSGPPIPLPVLGAARNTLRVRSLRDRIEGFPIGVLGVGSRRFFGEPTAGPSTGNHLDLQLLETTLATPACADDAAADLVLVGAWVAAADTPPGDGNTVHLAMRGVTGSGPRSNFFAHTDGPMTLPAELQGRGNRLTIAGSVAEFAGTNQGIDPAPAGDQFSDGSP